MDMLSDKFTDGGCHSDQQNVDCSVVELSCDQLTVPVVSSPVFPITEANPVERHLPLKNVPDCG